MDIGLIILAKIPSSNIEELIKMLRWEYLSRETMSVLVAPSSKFLQSFVEIPWGNLPVFILLCRVAKGDMTDHSFYNDKSVGTKILSPPPFMILHKANSRMN